MITYSYKQTVPKGVVTVRLVEGDRTFFSDGAAGQELHIAAGKRADVSRRKFIILVRRMVRTAKMHKLPKIAIDLSDLDFAMLKDMAPEERGSLIAENLEMANFEFNLFRSKDKQIPTITEVVFLGTVSGEFRAGVARGQIVGDEVNRSRALANMPAGDMTPELLAKAASNAAKGTKIKVTVLDEKKIAALKMGGVLGVARGSSARPRFIIMEYMGGARGEAPIVFVGKGVTFDTGGINIKPDQASLGMHMDMSGGAACIHAITAAARLKVKRNIITLVPAVENMVSGESYRPGDVLRSMSGITIDVLHTDAEGRIVLADALTYAERYKPALVVDAATLTGGVITALGLRASAILTKDQRLEDLFRKLGEETGEYVWPLPLWDEYEADIKGVFGDISNVPAKRGGGGSTINGGTFLYQFAKNYPWVHVDMASRMETIPEDELAQGSAGSPVRLFVKLAESYEK